MVVDSSRLAGNKLYHDVEGQDAGREVIRTGEQGSQLASMKWGFQAKPRAVPRDPLAAIKAWAVPSAIDNAPYTSPSSGS